MKQNTIEDRLHRHQRRGSLHISKHKDFQTIAFEDDSVFVMPDRNAHESNLDLLKLKDRNIQPESQKMGDIGKKDVFLPTIVFHQSKAFAQCLKNKKSRSNSRDSKWSKPRVSVHCKILMNKNCNFPLIKQNNSQRSQVNRNWQKQNNDFLNLDISRILEVNDSNDTFMSKESLQKIPIF